MSDSAHGPCATCGLCCRSYIVPINGHDLWRICVGQHLAPEQFAVAIAREPSATNGFILVADGPVHVLALDKQGRLAPKRPCVFLLHLSGGHDRCGIYADRPSACRAYPMTWRSNRAIGPKPNALCPPDAWPPDAGETLPWQRAVREADMRFDLYGTVVERWNVRVRASPGRRFALAEYYSYVLNVYDRLAELDRAIGEAELARVVRTWRRGPSTDASWDQIRARAAEYPWVEYADQVSTIVEGFYGESAARADD